MNTRTLVIYAIRKCNFIYITFNATTFSLFVGTCVCFASCNHVITGILICNVLYIEKRLRVSFVLTI
ncbi:hypothetical protein QVD17_41070 [Tagetes erecta]|uniref:Uncharacterized protein n=1 Tax=Tagetes erecta TaxID=13708 RepID=A0AAD8NB35_TARER|nr:hypothetical protein QVD17_41070 [Tagetes erecta]